MSGVVTAEMYSRSQPGIEERKRKCVQVLIDFGKVLSTYSGFFFGFPYFCVQYSLT